MSLTPQERAREWLDKWLNAPPGEQFRMGQSLAALLTSVQAEARLEEAKWWRYLVQMHEESYFSVEGDKRIADLEASGKPAEGT